MKKSIFSIISIAIFLVVFLVNGVFADNKTGSFEEQFQGSHYCAYVPEDCAKSENLALVVALHGAGGTARNYINAWSGVAKEHKFAVIAIKSKGQTWNYETSYTYIQAAIEDFKKHCAYNEKRILMTGFSAGAHLTLQTAVKLNKYTAIAPVGGGCEIRVMTTAELTAASDMPVYYIAGENDPNLAPIKQVKEKLEGYGYKVKLDVAPGLGHEYPNDASEKIWKWFDNIGHMHNLERIKTKADKAFEEKNIATAYDLFSQLLAGCSSLPAKYLKENKDKIEEYKKLAEEKLKELEAIWTEKEPDAFKMIEKCFKYIEKRKFYDAAKNFNKIIEKFANSEAAKLAKMKIDEILSTHTDVADKLAGSKPKSELKKAEKTLNKRNLKKEDKEKTIQKLEKIIAEYPHTSYAKRARELIEMFNK